MYIKQGDLFQGLSMDFLKLAMAATQREHHPEGKVLFSEEEPANYLYVIIKGRIECCINNLNKMAHASSGIGESFGWARLAGWDRYTATARCVMPTDVLKIDVEALQRLLDTYLEDGYVFYKNLAGILGKRLASYQQGHQSCSA
jgi:CRP-like cAMP-binding protein